MTQSGGDLSQYNSKEREEKNMTYFVKMNKHEQKILNVWLQYDCAMREDYEGQYDEDCTFEDLLKMQIEKFEEDDEEMVKEYRQALAEWQA